MTLVSYFVAKAQAVYKTVATTKHSYRSVLERMHRVGERLHRQGCLVTMPLLLLSSQALAQSAIERHVWQDARSFAPFSRTAQAITGTITLSGNAEFASEGSSMSLTFGNGAVVNLVSKGASWRAWDVGGQGKQTAEVFQLSDDPGPLENGNTLCGNEESEEELYAVFYEKSLFGGDPTLTMAVFRSAEPPFDINSIGLCGTFTYEISATTEERTAPVEPSTSADVDSGPGAWRVRTETNPIDDTKTVILSLAAESGTSRSGDPVVFIARCQSNKTEAYVVWGDYLGDDSSDVYSEWKKVIVRVGTGEAREERWGVSTDRKATFAPNWAGNLLKELLNEDSLVLQTIPYGENPNTAIFDVSGLSAVLGELARTCNWSF
jgi:hypothetical protein